VLAVHFPLHRDATRMLRRPQFAIWCGTELTADWHRRFRAVVVVHGHLHLPTSRWQDVVPFEEVSLGYIAWSTVTIASSPKARTYTYFPMPPATSTEAPVT
jgi:hypothetical protein